MLAPGKHVHLRFAARSTTLRMTYRRASLPYSSVILSKPQAQPKDPYPLEFHTPQQIRNQVTLPARFVCIFIPHGNEDK